MNTTVIVKQNGEAIIPAHLLKKWGFKPGNEIEVVIRPSIDQRLLEIPFEIPPDKTVQDFLNDFEERYEVGSDEFYKLWKKGLTEDTLDLNDWAGYCILKEALEKEGEDPAKATFKRYIPEGFENNV